MPIDGLAQDDRVLLKVKEGSSYRKGLKTTLSFLEGEVELQVEALIEGEARLKLVRMGLWGVGTEETGQVSLRGLEGTGTLLGDSLRLSFQARIAYYALEISQYDPDNSPQRDPFSGQLNVRLQERQAENVWAIVVELFHLQASGSGSAMIDEIRNIPGSQSAGSANRFRLDGLPCRPALQTRRKQLLVRAVFFRDDLSDPGTGRAWPAHLTEAQRIWRKCGIELVEQVPPVTITDPVLKQGNQARDVFDSHPGIPRTIYIFFVAGTTNGPGRTTAEGTAFARTIISDQAARNVTILAHEIGHVLDGDEPGRLRATTSWSGEPCTVMMPNGSLTKPISDLNTLHNCSSVKSDAFVSLGDEVCMRPDQLPDEC